MAADNKTIGRFILDGIPPAPRGVPQIEVSFDIDANGILSVHAKDKATGKEQKIRIEASSGLSKEEIERMKQEAELNAEADKKRKEEIDQFNAADALVFQTDKQLKEYGDKLADDKKAPIEDGLKKLKDAHAAKDFVSIDTAQAELQTAWNAASEEMYKASQEAGAGQDAPQGDATAQDAGDNVTDVDFEEVKEDDKK
jgi:molecular chaperone DnaK